MEPYNQPPAHYPQPGPADSGRQVKLILNILIVLTVLACGLLLFLILDGYGKLSINNLPADALMQLNGHAVTTNTTLRLRPGDYQVLVSSPLINPYQGTIHVSLLKTTTFTPKLRQRDPAAIIDSAIGSAGAVSAPPGITSTQWFDNNTWLGSIIQPGNSDIALHYDSAQKKWVVAYYNGGGYPEDLSKLPPDVAAYITSQENQNAGG